MINEHGAVGGMRTGRITFSGLLITRRNGNPMSSSSIETCGHTVYAVCKKSVNVEFRVCLCMPFNVPGRSGAYPTSLPIHVSRRFAWTKL